MKKIVVAVDSFKGSMTSLEAGNAVRAGIHKIHSDWKAEVYPVADGGEGTVEALTYQKNVTERTCMVTGPLGERMEASYIWYDGESGQTAVIEMAAAAGLPAFAALYWKKATKAGILSGMAAGFSVTIIWKLIGLPFGIGATVPGAIACALALVLVSLATYKKAPTPFLDPYAKQKAE